MSTFDASAFLNATVDAPLDTEFKAVPEGEFQAFFSAFSEEWVKPMVRRDGSPVLGKDGSPSEGQQLIAFEPRFTITDPKVEAILGRTPEVRGSAILDVKDGRIVTGPGRNVLLGQCMNAAGIKPGQPMSGMSGYGPIMVQIRHRPNDRDPSRPFAEVARVAPIR